MRLLSIVVSAVCICPGRLFADAPSPDSLASRIDLHLASAWKADGVRPSNTTSDEAFIRRVSLDLVGRVPPAADVQRFLADKSPQRRPKLVDRLVGSAAYARHAAAFWRRTWIPQAASPGSPLAEALDPWLTVQLRANRPYDRVVRDLLEASPARPSSDAAPTTFLNASEYKPENLAANTTRAFLGLNLDCAQCHNHPFARWSRDQFWQTAAFFTRPEAGAGKGKGTTAVRLEIAIPDTGKRVGPRLLTGAQPRWPAKVGEDTGRQVLAGWVTGRDNPYFARNAVNRVWANLFGAGLVEPLDDLVGGDEQGPHTRLLDELARVFTDSGFDLAYLTRALVLTRAYQLLSVAGENHTASPAGERLFARAAVRGLTGEQLYDSLRTAGGLSVDRDDLDPVNGQRERIRFAERFRVDSPGSAQRSILQGLSLMNGDLMTLVTDPNRSPMLRAVSAAPFLDTRARIESLYLAALARRPSAKELAPLVKFVDRHPEGDRVAKALADVFWALLNSSEFNTNH